MIRQNHHVVHPPILFRQYGDAALLRAKAAECVELRELCAAVAQGLERMATERPELPSRLLARARLHRAGTPRSVRISLCLLVAAACTTSSPSETRRQPARELVVTATAYNSTVAQTDSTPTVTAHGIRLTPGMQVIAVSPDLEAMGLRVGTRVQIEGLPGVWEVADRMPKRRRRAIDVYMGLDVAKARAFGRREVRVRWPETRP